MPTEKFSMINVAMSKSHFELFCAETANAQFKYRLNMMYLHGVAT